FATGSTRTSANDRLHDPLYHPVHRLVLIPVPHEHDVVFRIDPDDVRTVPECAETRRGSARPLFLLRVQPPEVAVVGTMCARDDGVLEPLLGNELKTLPLAVVQNQKAEACEILR